MNLDLDYVYARSEKNGKVVQSITVHLEGFET